MTYGFRLFRHVVQQVTGNFAEAVKITALPVGIFLVSGFLLFSGLGELFQAVDWADPEGDQEDMAAFISAALAPIAIGLIIFSVLFAWIAVAWHRFVLAEEYNSFLPNFSLDRVVNYIVKSLLILLCLIAVSIPAAFLFGVVLAIAPSLGAFLILGLNLFLTWLLVRWSLILPAGSVDHQMTLRESWNLTKPVAPDLWVPIIGFGLIFTIIGQVFAVMTAGPLNIALTVALSWAQMLVNLALLTTLYGNLAQGRDLN